VRTFLIAFTAAIVGIVLVALAFPEGEVVKLRTVDGRGRSHETVLWLVELDSGAYLRSGDPQSAWLARLRRSPEVTLERGSEPRPFLARPVDDPAVRRAVNEAMAEKYGVADRLVRAAVDVAQSVPIRLVPSGTRGAAAH
jgi:hypothetical protein